jgi:predicted AlkP superfamily pyrophosphatase or phosphodiesterase
MYLKAIGFSTIFLLFSLFNNFGYSQTAQKIPSDKPKLIVGIVVSQFRHDYISRYWDKFSDDGFKRLISRGTYCKNANYNFLASDKGVGTATIVTGATPAEHGIVGDSWYSDLKTSIIPSIYDGSVNTVGGPFEAGKCSPHQLLGSTFADELNLNNKFNSKVIGISLEPASAVLSAGHTANSAYWFDIQNGNFISSSFYLDTLPSWVNEFNNKKIPDTYLEQTWNTIYPIEEYVESLPDENAYEDGLRKSTVFPYEMDDVAKMFKKKERYSIMNVTPYGDNIVKDFAIQAIVHEDLGSDNNTDVLFMNFTSLEQIGNLFGPLSVEVEDAVLRLDKELAHLLNFIDDMVGMENTLVFFTAEHGLGHRPEYLGDHNIPSGYFNSTSAISLLKSYLNNIYGKGDWIRQYHGLQIYLNRTLIQSADLSLSEVQKEVANLMLQFHGVQNTLTATSLINTHYVEGDFRKIQNGYNQKRSGDVIINLKKGWVEKNGKSIISYGTDTRLPLIWYGWKVKRKTIIRPINLIDLAPTISVLLETSYPNNSRGVPIEEIIH